jgi:hypothetical protein
VLCLALKRKHSIISLGVPYHSWRITHAKHHASTGHMTQDQVFVPRTRSQRGLPPLNPNGENLIGTSISQEVMKELHEALGNSPIGAVLGPCSYLVRHPALFRNRFMINVCICLSSLAGPCTCFVTLLASTVTLEAQIVRGIRFLLTG